MKLQGRELSIESKGEDVALLQKELMQLGFEIADSELKDSLFIENLNHPARVVSRSTNWRIRP